MAISLSNGLRNFTRASALIAALYSTTALAQQSTSATQDEEDNTQKAAVSQRNNEEIVVTAQRREQRLSDVPIAISAQTGEALTQTLDPAMLASVVENTLTGQPTDMASLALFPASDAPTFITGTLIPVDGGYTLK